MNDGAKNFQKENDFELDTVDSIKKLLLKKQKKTPQVNDIPDVPQSETSKRKNFFSFKMISISIAALLAIIVGLVYFQKQEFSFSLLSGSPGNSSKNYLRVGPISTTLSNNSIIRFSVDIGLENESAKEKLAEQTAFVKNQIISTLTKPSAAELIETHQYDLLKAQIQENLEKTTGETVSEVFFSELRIF